MAEAIQLWVRTADGPLSVTADGGRATTVAQLRAQIAAMTGPPPAGSSSQARSWRTAAAAAAAALERPRRLRLRER